MVGNEEMPSCYVCMQLTIGSGLATKQCKVYVWAPPQMMWDGQLSEGRKNEGRNGKVQGRKEGRKKGRKEGKKGK